VALDPTSREANIRDSVKKYFVDNINRTEGIPLVFDNYVNSPKLQGIATNRWVGVAFGSIDLGQSSTTYIDIYCCTRQDTEGFKLAQLRDTVIGYLCDSTKTDGMGRIPFYRSYANQAWTLLGSFIVRDITESAEANAPDETKFKILTAQLDWCAIV
jgi:hypothetical protein